jgi:hypothetical protein
VVARTRGALKGADAILTPASSAEPLDPEHQAEQVQHALALVCRRVRVRRGAVAVIAGSIMALVPAVAAAARGHTLAAWGCVGALLAAGPAVALGWRLAPESAGRRLDHAYALLDLVVSARAALTRRETAGGRFRRLMSARVIEAAARELGARAPFSAVTGQPAVWSSIAAVSILGFVAAVAVASFRGAALASSEPSSHPATAEAAVASDQSSAARGQQVRPGWSDAPDARGLDAGGTRAGLAGAPSTEDIETGRAAELRPQAEPGEGGPDRQRRNSAGKGESAGEAGAPGEGDGLADRTGLTPEVLPLASQGARLEGIAAPQAGETALPATVPARYRALVSAYLALEHAP